MSGEWMKEFKRSASEKLRSPSAGSAFTSATESLTRSIKQSFHAGFLSRSFNLEANDDSQQGASESPSISQGNIPVQPGQQWTSKDTVSVVNSSSVVSRSFPASTVASTSLTEAGAAASTSEPSTTGASAMTTIAMASANTRSSATVKEPLKSLESTGSCSFSGSLSSSNPLTAFIFRRTPLSTKRSFDSSSQGTLAIRTDSVASSGEQHVLTHQKSTCSTGGASTALNLGGSLIHYPASSALHKISSSVTSLARAATGSSSSEMDDASPTGATSAGSGGKIVNSPRVITKADASASLSSSSMSHSPPTMISAAGDVQGGTPRSMSGSNCTPPLLVTTGSRAKAGWTRALNGSTSRNKREKKKSSLGVLDTSSSEDEVDDKSDPNQVTRQRSASTDDGSTPSPRTPNSFKILSGIDKNQATAFEFPPSPFASRHPSYERSGTHSERQSSDEYSTTVSSFRSRSTSSEVFEDGVGIAASSSMSSGCSSVFPTLTPIAQVVANRMTRRGLSPLKKQAAIAEEIVHSFATLDHLSNTGGDSVSSHSSAHLSSIGDSGLSDCPRTPPVSYKCTSPVVNSPSHKHSPSSYRSRSRLSETTSSSKSDSQTYYNSSETQVVSSPASVSVSLSDDNDDTSILFRRVTIRKRLAPIPPPPLNHTRCLSAEPSDLSHEFPRPSSEPLRPFFIARDDYDERTITQHKNLMAHVTLRNALTNQLMNDESVHSSCESRTQKQYNWSIVDESKANKNTSLHSSQKNEHTLSKHLDKLRVKSHLTTFDGVTYVEDSDWEIYSDSEWSNSQSILSHSETQKQSNEMKDSPWSSMSSLNTLSTLCSIDYWRKKTNETFATRALFTHDRSIHCSTCPEYNYSDSYLQQTAQYYSSSEIDRKMHYNAEVSLKERCKPLFDCTRDRSIHNPLQYSSASHIDATTGDEEGRCSSAPAVLFNSSTHRQVQSCSCVKLSVHEAEDNCVNGDTNYTSLSATTKVIDDMTHCQVCKCVSSTYLNSMKRAGDELIEYTRQRGKIKGQDSRLLSESDENSCKEELIGTLKLAMKESERSYQIFGNKNHPTEWTGTSKVTSCDSKTSPHHGSGGGGGGAAGSTSSSSSSSSFFLPDDQCTPTSEMKIISKKLNKQKANNHKRTHVLNFESEGGKAHLQDKLNSEWRHLCLKENLLHENEEEGKEKKVDEKNEVKVHNEIIQHTLHIVNAYDSVSLFRHLIESFENCFSSLESSHRVQSKNIQRNHHYSECCSSHKNVSTFQWYTCSRATCLCCYCSHCYLTFTYCYCGNCHSTLSSQLNDREKHLSPTHQLYHRSIEAQVANRNESTSLSHPVIACYICSLHPVQCDVKSESREICFSDAKCTCIEGASSAISQISQYITQCAIVKGTEKKKHRTISCIHCTDHLLIDSSVQLNLNAQSNSKSEHKMEMHGESHRILLKFGAQLPQESGHVTREQVINSEILPSPNKCSRENISTQIADVNDDMNSNFKLQRSVTKIHISHAMPLDALGSNTSVKKSSSSPSLLSSYNQHMIHVQVKHRCSNRLTTSHAPLTPSRSYFRPQSVNCIFTSPRPPVSPAVAAAAAGVTSVSPTAIVAPASSSHSPLSKRTCNDICMGDPSLLYSLPRVRMTKQNTTVNDKADFNFSSSTSSSFARNIESKGAKANSIRSATPHLSAKAQAFHSLMDSFDQTALDVNNDPSNALTLLDDHGNEETIWTRHSRNNATSHLHDVNNYLHNDSSCPQTMVDGKLTSKSHSLPRNHYQRRQRKPDTVQDKSGDACPPVCQAPGEKENNLTHCHESGRKVISNRIEEGDSHDFYIVDNDALRKSLGFEAQVIQEVTSTSLATLHPNQRGPQGQALGDDEAESETKLHEIQQGVPTVHYQNEPDWQTNYTDNSYTLPFKAVNEKCESRSTAECTPPRVNNELTVLNNNKCSTTKVDCCTAILGHRCHTSQRRHSNEGQNNNVHCASSSSSSTSSHCCGTSKHDDGDRENESNGTSSCNWLQCNGHTSCDDDGRQEEREEEEIQESIWQINKCNPIHLSRGKLVTDALIQLNNHQKNSLHDQFNFQKSSRLIKCTRYDISKSRDEESTSNDYTNKDARNKCSSETVISTVEETSEALVPYTCHRELIVDETTQVNDTNDHSECTSSQRQVVSPLCSNNVKSDTSRVSDKRPPPPTSAHIECSDNVTVNDSVKLKVEEVNNEYCDDRQNESDTDENVTVNDKNGEQLCDQKRVEKSEYPVRQEKEEVSGRLVTELTMHLTGRNVAAAGSTSASDDPHCKLQQQQQEEEKQRQQQQQYERSSEKQQHQCQALRRQHLPGNEIHSVNEVNSDCFQLTKHYTNYSHDFDSTVTQQQKKQQQQQYQQQQSHQQSQQSQEQVKQQDTLVKSNQPFNLLPTCNTHSINEVHCVHSENCSHHNNSNNTLNDKDSVNITTTTTTNNTNYEAIVTGVTSDAIWYKSSSPLEPTSSSSSSYSPPIIGASPSPSSPSSGFASDLSCRETKQIVPSFDSVSPEQSSSSPLVHCLLASPTGDFVSDRPSESTTHSHYSYPQRQEQFTSPGKHTGASKAKRCTSSDVNCASSNVTQQIIQADTISNEKAISPEKHSNSPSFVIQFSNRLSKQIVSNILGSLSFKANQQEKHPSRLALPNRLLRDNSTCSLASTDDLEFAPKPPPRNHRKHRKSRDFIYNSQYTSQGVVPVACLPDEQPPALDATPDSTVNLINTAPLPQLSSTQDTVSLLSRDTIEGTSNAAASASQFTSILHTAPSCSVKSTMPSSDTTSKSLQPLDMRMNKQMSSVSDGEKTLAISCCSSSRCTDTLTSTSPYLHTQSAFNSSMTSRVQQKATSEQEMREGETETNATTSNNRSHALTVDTGTTLYPFSDEDVDTEDPVLVDLFQDESGNYLSEATPSHHPFNMYYTKEHTDDDMHTNVHESISDTTFDDLTDYGNPFSYSLHTIVEESERSSADEGDDTESKRYSLCSTSPLPNRPLNPAPIALESSDVSSDEIFKVAKRISNSLSESLQGSDIETSSSESEGESNAQSSVKCIINPTNLVTRPNSNRQSSHQHKNSVSTDSSETNIDPVIVTSSRLEEYFTFVLLSDVESSHIKGSSDKGKSPRGQPTVQRVVTVNRINDNNDCNVNPPSPIHTNNKVTSSIDTSSSNDKYSENILNSSNNLNDCISTATAVTSSPHDNSNNSSVHQAQLSQSPKPIHFTSVHGTMSNNEQIVKKMNHVKCIQVEKKPEESLNVQKRDEEKTEQVREKDEATPVKQKESSMNEAHCALIIKQEEQVDGREEDQHTDTEDICSNFPTEKETNVDDDEDVQAEKVDNIEGHKSSQCSPPDDTTQVKKSAPTTEAVNVKDKQTTNGKSNSFNTQEAEKSIRMQSECKVKRSSTICQVDTHSSPASFSSSSSSSSCLPVATPARVSASSSSHCTTSHETGADAATMTSASISSRTQAVSQALESHCRNIISGATDAWKKFKDDGLGSSPHRLRGRTKAATTESQISSGTSTSGLPQISVSDYSANASCRSLCSSSDLDHHQREDGTLSHESKLSSAFPFQSSSSLSSIGIRSESLSSLFSSSGYRYGTVTISGEILFGLSYNAQDNYLELIIKECRNLAAVDARRNRSDPYVKVYLLPDRSRTGKRKTKVCKGTLNPVFNERVKFNLTMEQVESRSIWLTVWHSDRFGRNDFLGEVTLPLGQSVFDHTDLKWYPLQDKMEQEEPTSIGMRGSLFIALKFVPVDTAIRGSISSQARGELHVLIKEGHDLTCTRGANCNPFCKSYFLPDRSKTSKQKTPACKKTLNPKWNHTIVYEELTLADLKSRCIELTLWDYDKLSTNEFLGGVRLCLGTGNCEGRVVDWMDSVGQEVTLWHQMLNRPGMWVYGEVKLRSSMRCLKTI